MAVQQHLLTLVAGALAGGPASAPPLPGAACPCVSPELCEPVAVQHSKEIFGFLPGPDWRQLDWSTVTTVAWDNTKTNKSQDELVCEAHKHQTRVLAQASPGDGPGDCNLTRFGTNASVRAAFVASTVGECSRCIPPLPLR